MKIIKIARRRAGASLRAARRCRAEEPKHHLALANKNRPGATAIESDAAYLART